MASSLLTVERDLHFVRLTDCELAYSERNPELKGFELACPRWPGPVNEFKNAREIHFPPMEIPDEVARLIEQEVQLDS